MNDRPSPQRAPQAFGRSRCALWAALIVAAISSPAGHFVQAQPPSAGGTALRSPPRAIGNTIGARSSLNSASIGATSVPAPTSGVALQEPPRQFVTQPALSFDPYASPTPKPFFTSDAPAMNTLDETLWDDAVGVYSGDAYRDWTAQMLPYGLVYKSYLAGVKESRMATVFNYDREIGWRWDITLGGRVGLFRYGTTNAVRPEGFQIDLEGAAMPRLNLNNEEDLDAVDFRAGLPITYGIGRWQMKLAYYHLSSHAGDELLENNPGFQRINYVRDVAVLGQSYYITDDIRLYGEVGYGLYTDIAEPWEFQFGVDYSPLCKPGPRGAPFVALNGYLREELDFGGNFVAQAGWQWRPRNRGQLLRLGLQYYVGKSEQFEFYQENENKFGLGIWYDY